MSSKYIINIRCSEVLPSDGSGSRLWRSGHLSQYLSNDPRFKLTWLISSFDHYSKVHRNTVGFKSEELTLRDCVKILRTTGYPHNLSVMRFVDHFIFGVKTFFFLLKNWRKIDIIFTSFPTVESSFFSVLYGMIFNVQTVVDIRDKWPDVFFEAKAGNSFLYKILFFPYYLMRWFTFRYCTSIVAANEDFLSWAQNISARSLASKEKDKCFPIGFKIPSFSSEIEEKVNSLLAQCNIKDDEIIISFGGTLGTVFNFDQLVDTFKVLDKEGFKYKFLIFGSGDKMEYLKRLFQPFKTVYFLGRVDSSVLFYSFKRSHLLLAPYIDSSNFRNHFPNKISEYLAAAKPIITSLSGSTGEFLKSVKAGFFYKSGEELAQIILKLTAEDRVTCGENGFIAFCNQFDIEAINKQIADHCHSLTDGKF